MKGTVIFADQNQKDQEDDEKKDKPLLNNPQGKISLSRDEYREIIKEAYKEGMKEAASKSKNSDQDDANESDEETAGRKEGEREAVKNKVKEEQEAMHKLAAISKRHDIELLRVSTVFPFNLFPDTLIIDTTKMTIVKTQFFATEQVTTIPLKEISDITMQTAFFLASVTFQYMPQTSSPGTTQPIFVSINALKRKDAIRVKSIIKGALVAKAENIDIAKLSPDKVVEMVEKLGYSEGVE
jgi:hypothetical protein